MDNVREKIAIACQIMLGLASAEKIKVEFRRVNGYGVLDLGAQDSDDSVDYPDFGQGIS